jgi:hypothetical protein
MALRMNPSKLRLTAGLIGAVLALDLIVASVGDHPVSGSRAEGGRAVAAPRSQTDRHGAPPARLPGSRRVPRGTPLAGGEPAAPAILERSAPARPSSWIASAFPAQSRAVRSTARGGNAWALIIGINEYRSPTRDNVGSYQDATALRSYLRGLGWRSDHIVLIGNAAATRQHVVDGLRWLASKADARSTVVFHFSGHEMPYHGDVDGDGEALDVALWLSDNKLLIDHDLGRLLDPVRAAKMWLNFAVCRAGGFNDPGTAKAGRLITYSSPVGELSYEDPSVSHSVFGYYSIVEGMKSRQADANGDAVTTVQEAFAYARPRVIDRTGQRQHPAMVDGYGDSFSLVPPAPPDPTPAEPSGEETPCTLPLGCARIE